MSEPSAEFEGRFLERKLVTILSADVAEFSRMMGEDEEETLRTFRAHKAVFESLVKMHRGRIFNTAGDAILAEFSSAVDAVRCATDIQSALRTRNDQLPLARQVRFRIGINVGDVLLQEQDLLGDGVNVAARLQAAAEPGGICLSGSVHDQIRNKLSLSFRHMGELKFKNIQQPVRTFSIADGEQEADVPRDPPKRHRVLLTSVVLAVVVVLGGIGYWSLWKPRWGVPATPGDSPPKMAAPNAPGTLAIATVGPEPSAIPKTVKKHVSASLFDGIYSGPICYSETATEPRRCYEASGSIRDSRISSEWVMGREKKTDMIMTGEVSPSGDVTIRIESHAETDATRLATIEFAGTIHDGVIRASGAFRRGRAATLEWRKVSASDR